MIACGNPAHPLELVTILGAIMSCGGITGLAALVKANFGW